MNEEWLTVTEIAELLKVKDSTVREWLRGGKLRGRNFGGRTGWRVRLSDLETFLECDSKTAA